MAITSTAATANSVVSDALADEGSSESRSSGGDLLPMTLSTANASGTGVSNESGVARRPSKKMPRMWSQ